MTKKKTTRRALTVSIISLLLCVSMLVGTTFAWFTDSVTSGKNQIIAGNLDIELEYSKDMTDGSWKTVEGAEDLVDPNALWEPGHTEVVYLKITNKGTLALKYQFAMNFADTVVGKSVLGNDIYLSKYLKYDVVDVTAKFADREAAREAVEDSAKDLADYSASGEMLAGAAPKTVALVIYMPEEVGNEANYRGTNIPKIELGVTLFATQLVAESDSFGPDYDQGAAWTGDVNTDWYFDDPAASEFTVDTAEELAGFAALVNGTATAPVTTYAATAPATVQDSFEGKTVKLGANIDLNDAAWTPIGQPATSTTDFSTSFKGTFDGQGYTVSNLYVNNGGFSGLFGLAYKATIKNVKVAGADIRSNRMAGSVVGQLYGSLDNCHATNVTIRVVPNAVGNSYDNGDKVGGIVGWIGDNGNGRALTNCSVKTAKISAYRDVGGIAGYVAYSTTVSGNSVTGATIVVDQMTNHYGEKDANAGEIWGRNSVSNSGVGVEASNNTATEVTIDATYMKNGLVLTSDGKKVTLHSVPATYEEDTVTVPQEVTALANGAFAYNSNVKTVIIPATVTDFGGTPNEAGTGASGSAFKKSAVETVVLAEGITEIPAAAFNQAGKLKSVNIPASVTTIGINAFAYAGLETLTIPATVTSIGYGAFRGMPELTTATIEGNVNIPIYAFRECPALRNVFLNGNDVTFGAGSRGMIFTNKQNGDGSAITVIVKNVTVKDRLLATDTAAKDYGGYTILVESVDVNIVSSADALIESLESGKDVFMTDDVKIDPAGMSNAYGTTGINVKNGQTIDGGGNVLDIKGAGGTWDSGISTTGGVIKNITITGSFRGIFVNHTSDYSEPVVLENVTIDGTVYTISCDQGLNQTLKATNSTFKGWTSYAATLGSVEFVGCYFGEGSGYAYCRPYAPTTFVGCDFEAGFEMDAVAAVTFENCTIGGVPLTAENLATLVTSNTANATVK